MSWISENKQAAVTIGVCGVLVIALVGVGVMRGSAAGDAEMAYEASFTSVKNLERKPTTPEADKVAELNQLVTDYSGDAEELKGKLVEFGVREIEPMQPSAFQERLTAAVNEFQQKVGSRRDEIMLPEDFYFGFGTYQRQLPRKEAAGMLAYELEASQWLFDQMLDMGLKRVISIVRKEIDQEQSRPAANNRFGAAAMGPEPIDVLERMPLEVVVEIRKDGWSKLLTAIADRDAEHFFAIRGLRVINEKTSGPNRNQVTFDGEDDDAGDDAAAPFAGDFDFAPEEADDADEGENGDSGRNFDMPGDASGEEIVKPVLGTENVYLALQLEVIHFKSDVQIPGSQAPAGQAAGSEPANDEGDESAAGAGESEGAAAAPGETRN